MMPGTFRPLAIKYGVILLFIVIIASGCAMFPQEEEILAPPLVKPEEEVFELYTVTRKDISRLVQATGTLISSEEQTVFFENHGVRLDDILVEPGDNVASGDLLASGESGRLEEQIKLHTIDVEILEIDLRFLNEANIVLDSLKEQLNQMRLTSPVEGIVTYVADFRQGDTVDPFHPVVTVANPLELQIRYQGVSVMPVRTGMNAKVTYRGEEYQGEVVMAPDSPRLGQETINRDEIRIMVKNLPKDAQMGNSIDIEIIIQHKEDALVIPRRALQRFMGETTVLVMDNGAKRELNVEVGIETSTEVEIISGLYEGQSVIVH
jgi:multidrug efflux pump subunit AcrA (membrane-fusion protein)